MNSLILPTGRARLVTLVVAALVVAGSVAVAAHTWITRLPADVAVRVGDTDISTATLQRRINVLSAIYGVEAPESGAKLRDFQRASAKSIAISTVLDQAAADRDIVIANKTLEDELSKIVSEQNGDRSSFVTFLGEKGLRESDIIDELRRSRTVQRLFDQVTAAVPAVTRGEARQEFAARRSAMHTAEQRRLANIVVANKADAEEVVRRVRGGDAFADVANAMSLDSSTAQSGGDLGQDVAQTDVEPAYGAAAFAAKKGELFGPVQTQSGWNVGTVLAIRPVDQLSFAEVEPTLLTALTARRKQTTWTTWVNERIKAAGIEYADRFRPADTTVENGELTGVNGQ